MRLLVILLLLVVGLSRATRDGTISVFCTNSPPYTDPTYTVGSLADELATCKAVLDRGTVYLLDSLHQVKEELHLLPPFCIYFLFLCHLRFCVTCGFLCHLHFVSPISSSCCVTQKKKNMKRSRENEVEELPNKQHKTNDSDNESIEALMNDPTFSQEGSYLVITDDWEGNDDVEYHICTTDNFITVHDAQGRLLKRVRR